MLVICRSKKNIHGQHMLHWLIICQVLKKLCFFLLLNNKMKTQIFLYIFCGLWNRCSECHPKVFFFSKFLNQSINHKKEQFFLNFSCILFSIGHQNMQKMYKKIEFQFTRLTERFIARHTTNWPLLLLLIRFFFSQIKTKNFCSGVRLSNVIQWVYVFFSHITLLQVEMKKSQEIFNWVNVVSMTINDIYFTLKLELTTCFNAISVRNISKLPKYMQNAIFVLLNAPLQGRLNWRFCDLMVIHIRTTCFAWNWRRWFII